MALGRFCGFKAFADGPLSGSGGGALGEVNGARTGSFSGWRIRRAVSLSIGQKYRSGMKRRRLRTCFNENKPKPPRKNSI